MLFIIGYQYPRCSVSMSTDKIIPGIIFKIAKCVSHFRGMYGFVLFHPFDFNTNPSEQAVHMIDGFVTTKKVNTYFAKRHCGNDFPAMIGFEPI